LKKILAASSSPFSVPDPKTCSCWSINRDAMNSTWVGRKSF
jgi:hypothetical protein